MELRSIITKKKGWIIRDLIPALIIFALVSGIFYLMVGDTANRYNNPNIVDPSFNAHYNNLNSLSVSVGKMYNSTNPNSNPQGLQLLGTFGTVFQAMISVIGLIFDSIGGISTQTGYALTDFGVPPIIAALVFAAIIGIVTVIIVLTIINSAKFGRL